MTHIFVVQLDIPAEREAEFNRIYDTEHFPMLSKVPGIRSAARCTRPCPACSAT
jgi:hypothetical protein